MGPVDRGGGEIPFPEAHDDKKIDQPDLSVSQATIIESAEYGNGLYRIQMRVSGFVSNESNAPRNNFTTEAIVARDQFDLMDGYIDPDHQLDFISATGIDGKEIFMTPEAKKIIEQKKGER